ncbi:MAG: peptidylprolyl isomerase [Xanthomonadales bacterium]|jgi:hypothetical protein|nr:peptidylprolyl isomerase [Xanthomonadales bacterium]
MGTHKSSRKSNRTAKWLREPLVHFLLIGGLLFLGFHFWGGGGPSTDRIVITPGQIDSMVARFTRTWQRPPTEEELKGLIDDHVREEMAAREAMAMGLDRDDTIIRRRLRQKLEFLAEDAVTALPPTDAELERWFDAHAEDFRIEPEIGFFQVYLNPDKRGNSIQDDARKILEHLRAAGPPADNSLAGDALMLPNKVDLTRVGEVSRVFGRSFADEILALEPGRWSGPIASGYGLHLVYVTERKESRMPPLIEVRPMVERDLLAARRKEALNAMYEAMLRRYQVTVEQRGDEMGSANAAAGPVSGESP